MSLRARLLVALVALAAIRLVLVDVVTATSLRSFLFKRVDQQLNASVLPMTQALSASGGGPAPGNFFPGFGRRRPGLSTSLPPGTYGDERDSSGVVQTALQVTLDQNESRKADVPKVEPKAVVSAIAAGNV